MHSYVLYNVWKVCREMVSKLTRDRYEGQYQLLYANFQEAAPQRVCALAQYNTLFAVR